MGIKPKKNPFSFLTQNGNAAPILSPLATPPGREPPPAVVSWNVPVRMRPRGRGEGWTGQKEGEEKCGDQEAGGGEEKSPHPMHSDAPEGVKVKIIFQDLAYIISQKLCRKNYNVIF